MEELEKIKRDPTNPWNMDYGYTTAIIWDNRGRYQGCGVPIIKTKQVMNLKFPACDDGLRRYGDDLDTHPDHRCFKCLAVLVNQLFGLLISKSNSKQRKKLLKKGGFCLNGTCV